MEAFEPARRRDGRPGIIDLVTPIKARKGQIDQAVFVLETEFPNDL